MGVAGLLHRGVETRPCPESVLRAAPVEHRGQIRAAAEPGLGGDHDSGCSCARPGRAGSADGRSARCPTPRTAGRRRRPGYPCGIRARTRRTRSRRGRPTLLNTRPCSIDITPPLPGAPLWSVRLHGCAQIGRARAQRRARRQCALQRLEVSRRISSLQLCHEPSARPGLAGFQRGLRPSLLIACRSTRAAVFAGVDHGRRAVAPQEERRCRLTFSHCCGKHRGSIGGSGNAPSPDRVGRCHLR